MPLILTAGDRQTALWAKIKDYYEGRLQDLRVRNDGLAQDERTTAFLRGQIAEIKSLLQSEQQSIEQDRTYLMRGIPVIQ